MSETFSKLIILIVIHVKRTNLLKLLKFLKKILRKKNILLTLLVSFILCPLLTMFMYKIYYGMPYV